MVIEDLNDQALADILAEAFHDDPAMNWAMAAPPSPAIFRHMIEGLYRPKGICQGIEDKAAALWLPPGVKPGLSLRATIALGPSMISNGGLRAVYRGLFAESNMSKVHPHEPHYYLFAVGTTKTARGQGLGKAVLQPVLERCDDEQIPAYLENSKPENTGFYRSLGFANQGPPLVLGPGAPSIQPMWREPTAI